MKGRIRSLIVSAPMLAAVVACGSSGLPESTVAVVTPVALASPPIYSLLGYRSDLQLSSEQIAALDSIAQDVQKTNGDLAEELSRMSDRPRTPTGAFVVMPEGEPILDQLRHNQKAAGEAVGELLSEDQRNRVCELFDRDGRARRSSGGNSATRQSAQRRDVDNRVLGPAGWPWCGDQESDDTTHDGTAEARAANARAANASAGTGED